MLATLTITPTVFSLGFAAQRVSTRALKQTIPTPGAVPVPTTVTTAPGVVTTVNVPIATGPSTTLGPAPAPAPGSMLFGLTYSPIVGPPIQNTSSRASPGFV
ncbi:g3648 [Coccomyxa elongata]